MALLGLSVLLTFSVGVALALGATKQVDSFFGSPTGATGDAAGVFNTPRGVAVNETGAGGVKSGDVYVVDSNNRRVQEFEADGTFVRAFGLNVGGAGVDICTTSCGAGTNSSAAGGFGTPEQIAINQSTGQVFVTDQATGNRRVDIFSAEGVFEGAFGWGVESGAAEFQFCTTTCQNPNTSGASGGQFGTRLSGIAISPANGDVYVADESNRRVQEFSVTGSPATAVTFVRAFGWDVDASGGSGELESCTSDAPGACQTGESGAGLGQFGNNSPSRIAIDSSGKVYTVDSANKRIQTFGADGTRPAVFFAAEGLEAAPTDVTVGPSDGVFVLQPCPSSYEGQEKLCPDQELGEARIEEFNSAGQLQSTSLEGAGFGVSFAAVNGISAVRSGDKVYFSTSGGTPGSRVWAVDDDGAAPLPTVTINPVSEITAHSAGFSGTVDPNGPPGLPTSYRFEYSKNGVTWIPVAPEVNLGEGINPIAVPTEPAQGEVNDLQADTFYRVRIVASKAFGAGTTVSPEVPFLTDSIGPELQTLYPETIADNTARLTGKLDANNLPTTYHFELGTTTKYGTDLPTPDATASDGVTHVVVAEAPSLQPNTTYHYRLVATNAEGTTKGEDVSFNTRSAESPSTPERAYEMVTPPFKSTRSVGKPGGSLHRNQNVGTPSLNGERFIWNIPIFPLDNEAAFPFGGDIVEIHRTPDGWVHQSLLTQQPLPGQSPSFKSASITSNSGNFAAQSWKFALPLLEDPDGGQGSLYTRRGGTGTNGFTSWPAELNSTTVPYGLSATSSDGAQFNDDGSWMARWGRYRGLLGSSPATDPSVAQLSGTAGGSAAYLQQDPPTGSLELINGCEGTTAGGDATEIPARVGIGTATDTIGVQDCQEDIGVLATGTGTRAAASPTLSGINTESGAFAVGQMIFGEGIPRGAVITAVGAGTLTLSANAECGQAAGTATRSSGSSTLTSVVTTCGAFEVGQTISGTGIPAGATVTAVGEETLTISASATSNGSRGAIAATASATTELSARDQSVVNTRGAIVGGGNKTSAFNRNPNLGTAASAMSEDGQRVYFESPDPEASGVATTSCKAGVGAATECPPQLFLRDRSGAVPTVTWVSRSRSQAVGENGYSGSMIAGQQVGLVGAGAGFEGASRDGSIVYFRSDAPLTPDDPNGAGVAPPAGGVTTGTASTSSWDLYQYKLPTSGNPGEGTLTRISGGPNGNADPDTERAGAPGEPTARYISDDGKRAYFVTSSPIAGADNAPPKGGVTVPGGTVGNETSRDLYLFDETKTGTERYKFIAQLPTRSGGQSNVTCAALEPENGGDLFVEGFNAESNAIYLTGNKCFRGTPSGSAVIFETPAQLTADDTDEASDIYLYDARRDELTRISAPPPGESGYGCKEMQNAQKTVQFSCNADLGFNTYGGGSYETNRGWSGGSHYNIAEDSEGHVSVYFESRAKLLPQDTNSGPGTDDYWDVYQWREGKLSLVSPGNTDDDAYYSGNGLDGRDVFFETTQRIDPRELDSADVDIYDARIGGGIPYTPPAAPCNVLALQCEGNAAAAPAAVSPASREFSGPGNVKEGPQQRKKCGKGKVRRHGKCLKKRGHKSRRKRHRKKHKKHHNHKRAVHVKHRGNK